MRALIFMSLLALQGLAMAQTLLLKDDTGREHRLARPAERVVSLLPSLTESVHALGATARLVGVDRYSNWPEAIAKLPRLGGLDDVQIETIAALKPDVVLASTSARSLDRLEALGFTVLRLKSESHADVQRTLVLLARLIGQPERADPLWARLQQQLDAAAARVPARLRGQSVYFEIGGGPYAAGAQSFIGQTLARLGLPNAVPASLGPFPKLNPEFIVQARPGIVMGAEKEQAGLKNRPGWASIPALQRGRLCAFATPQYEILIRPGPRMGEAAELIADCLERLP
ncbi:iron complex transport system substrate-binding protein [Inhella inkyongensis]|uniref:Iron complex transport system substrate-binding protein n=1 Tax=Inhella inkyongensis TaxID=392593 RepID=A0A840S8V8_9BURK|nr:ABC transporter substrate-binding protein [Inhella inkyongensis]MBB5204849.1 iron complex transport system substrate-binding protein [Inhella inkyongensis]